MTGVQASPVLAPPSGTDRFDRGRRTVGLIAGPVVALAVYANAGALAPAQRSLAAVMVFVVIFWATEPIPIPVTALLGLALASVAGVAPPPEVFGAFSSPVIFLFIGSFIIARAMTIHGLDRRFAFRVLSLPGVAQSTYRIVVAFGVCAALLSSVISNTAAVAMLLPIAVGVLRAISELLPANLRGGPRLRLGTALMLMTAYGASVGGLLTPIGSPANLIGREFIAELTGVEISFFGWMLMTLPIVVAMFAVLSVVLLLLNRPEVRRLEGATEYIRGERSALGPLTRAERNTLLAFAVAVTLWVLPGIVGLLVGESSSVATLLGERADEGTVAILAAALLFLLPVDWPQRRFTLSWEQAVRIDWGTVLLFGSGIALGTLLSDTGLAGRLGGSLATSLGMTSLITLTASAALAAVLLSETTSNTAAVGIVVPILIPVAQAAGVDPLIPALAAVFGASYGFMLPVSTPPNAIVYASGMVPITRMLRSGAAFDVAGVLLITAGLLLLGR
ncbi:MAG: DASS family sodium-coupled anion symporter [Egibacteraceae bacterium]